MQLSTSTLTASERLNTARLAESQDAIQDRDPTHSLSDRVVDLGTRQQNLERSIADIKHVHRSAQLELNQKLEGLAQRVRVHENLIQCFATDVESLVTPLHNSLPTMLLNGNLEEEFGRNGVPRETRQHAGMKAANPMQTHQEPQADMSVFESLRCILLEDIRREVANFVPPPNTMDQHSEPVSDASKRITRETFESIEIEATSEIVGREFEESIWDAAVLVGTKYLPLISTAFLAITLLVNILGQAIFCLVIESQFSETNLPTNDRMTYWRASAHESSNADPTTGTSLVARVCNWDDSLQVASSQVELIQNIENYLSPVLLSHFKSGPTIFVLSWILWAMVAFKEASANLDLFVGFCSLPRGERTHVVETEHALAIERLSLKHLAFLALLSLVRLFVCISLFWFGSKWLANTLDIEDLVLNAAALKFTLEMPNTLFDVFMPPVIKATIRILKPMSLPDLRNLSGACRFVLLDIGCRPLLAVAFVGFSLALCWTYDVAPIIHQLETLNHTSCGGDQNFVWSFFHKLDFMLAVATPEYEDRINDFAADQQYKLRSAEEIWNRTDNSYRAQYDRKAWIADYHSEYELVASSTVHQLTYNMEFGNNLCNSEGLFFNRTPFFIRRGLLSISGNYSATSCDHITSACGHWSATNLRLWCPSQCGCANPRSGLFYNGPAAGCPREKCISSPGYKAALSEYECKDSINPSQHESADMNGWIRYWDEFLNSAVLGHKYSRYGYDASDVAEYAKLLGCSFLRKAEFFGSFCYETDVIGSIAAFCPVTCGCRRTPSLPGCPTKCEWHSILYYRSLEKLPCEDVVAGTLTNGSYSSWLTFASLRFEHWYYNDIVAQTLLRHFYTNLTLAELWAIIDTNGCDGIPDSLCSELYGAYSIVSLCPSHCGCKNERSANCPPKCVFELSD